MAARPSYLQVERGLATARNRSLPALTLSHPLLRAVDSCPCGGKAFDQALAQILVFGLFQHPLAAGRAVKRLCSSSSSASVAFALSLFSHLDDPDAFVGNTILRAYARSGDPAGGLSFYRDHVLRRGVHSTHYTYPLLTKLCADAGWALGGASMHARVVQLGFETDLFVQNSLIYMYSSFGHVEAARCLFDLHEEADLVTWNSMIDGYVKNGMVSAARELFEKMEERDILSWNVMIAGHLNDGDIRAAKRLFHEMPERDTVTWNTMVDGCGKAGDVPLARELFDAMPSPNVVSWNTILATYVRAKDYRECLRLFDRMMAMNASPTEATLVSVLTSCSHSGELERGKWVHSYIKSRKGSIQHDVLLSTALLNMYSKCGEMGSAREIFEQMPEKSVVSWNSMIMGYGMHGHGDKAILLYMEMEREGQSPNAATFICLLSACAHAGLVLEGWWCFDRMVHMYNIEPKIQHYGCMIDLLSRAGLLDQSTEVIRKLPMHPSPSLLGALLSACKSHSNSELGEIVGRKLIELKPRDVGPYVLLSDMYAAEGRWNDVANVRSAIKERGLLKGVALSF